MYELTTTDKIWNRACIKEGGQVPCVGDRKLTALLFFHGMVMNGGVLHALECCDSSQLSAAEEGYKFYGFKSIKKIILEGFQLIDSTGDFKLEEQRLDNEYENTIDDEVLQKRFIKHFEDNPDDYASL